MGFFDLFKMKKKGDEYKKKQQEAIDNHVDTNMDNLKVGGSIKMPMLFTPQLADFSERYMKISDHHNIKFKDKKPSRWGVLDSGDLFIKKNGFKVELIRKIQDIDSFMASMDEELIFALLELEEHEVTGLNGEEVINSDDKLIKVTENFSMLKTGDYLVQRDELFATSNMFDSGDFRYIEIKSMDSKNYIYIFIMNDGETLVFESEVRGKEDFDFV